ncbi:hypothetical protein KKG51_01180 [Patescibacteria group bacterium]|nr:hypothetical protein [Patescibacteria group bacterium]
MTRKEYLVYLLLLISITLSFFFGYFICKYEKVEQARGEIRVVPEINGY